MMRRFLLLVTGAVLVVAMALPAWAAEEEKEPGKPDHPNCWGTVVSEVATTTHTVGEHSSSQEEPRQGVGNVARTDGADGDHPGDHGRFVGGQMGLVDDSCNTV
jgi:hypothetical protein